MHTMDDVSSQSMSEAEVYWNCDSPTPTAWRRHQAPCSNEPHRRGISQDVKHIQHVNKKVKTSLFEVDKKSFDIARKLINELGKQNNEIDSSLDSIFERSGNGEQLGSTASNDVKQTGEEDIWADEFMTDECLMQKLYEIQKAVPSVSTSTPLRPTTADKQKIISSNGNFSTPDDCLEFFMSAEMKGEKSKTASPVLKSKMQKKHSEIANFSITDDILSQLIMDDSWVESCSKTKTTTQAKNNSNGKTEKSNFRSEKFSAKQDENKRTQNMVKAGTHTMSKTVANQNKPSGKTFSNKGATLHSNKSGAMRPNHSTNIYTANVLKNINSKQIPQKIIPQKPNQFQSRNSMVKNKKIESTTNSAIVKRNETLENLFGDDDEDLLLQAVVLSESQKSSDKQISPTAVKPKKCSADEIERKKQEAIKRRLQRTRK